MKIQPDLSVCTAVVRNARSLRILLTSLAQQTGSAFVETVLVDSTGQVASLFSDKQPQRTIYEDLHETKKIRALNRGLSLARGRYIALADPDIQLYPSSLQKLLSYLDANPEVGIVSPKIVDAHGNPEPVSLSFPSLLDLANSPVLSPETSFVDCLISGFQILRRETWDDIGYLDDSLEEPFPGIDYAFRAQKAGWHVSYFTPAIAMHANPGRYHREFSRSHSSFSRLRSHFRFLLKKWFVGPKNCHKATF